MAYIIQYNSKLNRKYPKHHKKYYFRRNYLWIMIVFLLAFVGIAPVRNWVLDWIVPSNFHTVFNAFSKLITTYGEEKTFSEAVIFLGREMLANG